MSKLPSVLASNGYSQQIISDIAKLLDTQQKKATVNQLTLIEKCGASAAVMKLEPAAIVAVMLAQARWLGVGLETSDKTPAQLADEVAELRQLGDKLSLNPSRKRSAINMVQWLRQSSKDSPALLLLLLAVAAELALVPTNELAQRALLLYAPAANRLGLGELRNIMEDRAFKVLFPNEFAQIDQKIADANSKQENSLKKVKRDLSNLLRDVGIKAEEIHSRHKHYYSVYKKLPKKGDLDKILDLWALRVIVPTTADCYETLGVVHEIWQPIEKEKFTKDYIAKPKSNGYRSLHTVVDVEGQPVEIQIRTPAMHEVAERGSAAHWQYDELKDSRGYRKGRVAAKVKQIPKKRIYVFTPQNDLINLPIGSTALDFAFAVHSNLGLQARAVKINGKIAKLSDQLESGDSVEVVTQKSAKPSQGWLQFVKTAKARNRIRHQLKST